MSVSHDLSEQYSAEAIRTILNGLDALVYVADMQTHELIFFNDYGIEYWGEPGNKKCWQLLQSGQTGPCDFCTNMLLVDKNGKPTGVHVWEFQNTVNGNWYQCRDQAIRWVDGRLVRMEIATDITKYKKLEQELHKARENAEKLAETDHLTGLKNRRAFFSFGKQIFSQSRRVGHPVSLVMFDLDHFKKVNDRYGHVAGDEILVSISQVILDIVRDADVFARLGGEEFAVLLPETHEEEAVQFAERLRAAVSDQVIIYEGNKIQVTASFGVSCGQPGIADEFQLHDHLRLADKALYQAKAEGRNRVCIKTIDG